MRNWDYNGFAVGPVLTSLEHIFDQKNHDFFWKKDFFGYVINRPERPILMKKVMEIYV